MAQSRVMVDGSRVGTKLVRGREEDVEQKIRSSVHLMSEEVDAIRKILRRAAKRELVDGELSCSVAGSGKSVVRITLRQDNRDKKMWYLNLDGNPLKFMTGQNVYGKPEADKQIVEMFQACVAALEAETGRTFPQRLKDEVKEKRIHVNALEFAAYSPPVRDKKRIINAWTYMFRRSNVLRDVNGMNRSLAEILRVRLMSNDDFEDTLFGFATLTENRVKEVMFTVYDKEAELDGRLNRDGEVIEYDVVAESERATKVGPKERADIKNRLRFDVGLTSVWFNNRKIKTLLDLSLYVKRVYAGDWVELVRHEVQKAMERACLIDMWMVDRDAVLDAHDKDLPTVPGLNPKIPTTAWLAMVEARSEFGLTDELKANKLSADPEKKAAYLTWLDANAKNGLAQKDVARLRVTKKIEVAP